MTSPVRPGPSAATVVVGVMGDPVAHSLSPLLHNTAFGVLGLDWVSVGFPVPAGAASPALAGAAALGVRGLSVTMPHKEAVAGLVDRCTDLAARLGSVNCVTFSSAGSTGDSTDGPGFVAALRRGADLDPSGRRCLVVGAGGAARAVVVGLAEAGASEVVVVNRSLDRAHRAAALAGPAGRVGGPEEARGCDLVVNATPLGMVGAPAQSWPVDPAFLGPHQVVADLVYHPRTTPWLAAAAAVGARTVGGIGMLVHQAVFQLERWTGLAVPVEPLWAAVADEPGPE